MIRRKRILIGLVVRLGLLGGLAFYILEPERRGGVLPLVLGLGALAYLTGEWFRGRRARP